MITTIRRSARRQGDFQKRLPPFPLHLLLISGQPKVRPRALVTRCLLLLAILRGVGSHAQTPARRIPIDILSAENEGNISLNGHTGREYRKNVRLRHGDLTMLCDWAFYNDSTNQLTASGRVQLTLDESTVIKADTLYYQGDQQQAFLRGQVTFQHHGLLLNTSQVDYSQLTGIIHYADKPRIVGDQYLLTIREGHYDRENRQFATRPEVPPIILSLSKATVAPIRPDSVNTSTAPTAETATLPTRDSGERAPVNTVSRPVTAKPVPTFAPAVMVRQTNTLTTPGVVKKPAVARPVSASNKIQLQSETIPAPLPKSRPNPETAESELERLLNPRKEPR